LVASYPQVLSKRAVMGYFMGSMYPITVGIYSALFSQRVRARVASIIIGSSWLAASALGFAASAVFKAGMDWHVLLWVGAIPVVLSVFAPLIVPDDRTLVPYGGASATIAVKGKLPITELFVPALRNRTIMLTLLAGLNFFAYQALYGCSAMPTRTQSWVGCTRAASSVAFSGAGWATVSGAARAPAASS
jgi:hypothetical protein